MFLLGAGASFEAGLPLGKDLTRPVVAHLASLDDPKPNGSSMLAINYVMARLAVGDAVEVGADLNYPDFETALSALDLLQDLSVLEIAPFVEAWDATVTKLSNIRSPIDIPQWSRILKGAIESADGGEVARYVADIARGGQYSYSAFTGSGFLLRVALIPVLERVTSLEYLRPLLHSEAPLEIATLNYDRTIETLAAQEQRSVCQGVEQLVDTGRVAWDTNADVHLLKLHGSIDWYHRDEPMGFVAPGATCSCSNPGKGALRPSNLLHDWGPMIVAGRRGKLQAVGPYLQLFEDFRTRLATKKYLFTIGYSFGDEHINYLINQWQERSVKNSRYQAVVINVDPKPQSEFPGLHNVRLGAGAFLAGRGKRSWPEYAAYLTEGSAT